METLQEVLQENNAHEKIIRAVYRKVSDNIEDINKHGADAGYSGFTYYRDTIAFYQKYRQEIIALLADDVCSLGYQGNIEMISDFNCLKNMDISHDVIAIVLYAPKNRYCDGDDTLIRNALTWYALEKVCGMFED